MGEDHGAGVKAHMKENTMPNPLDVVKSNLPLPSMRTPTTVADATTPPRTYNTSKLGLRIGADALSAASAGSLVAPIITMIDKGIIENASGRATLSQSLKASAVQLLARPHTFLASKPFLLIFSLYFGTYFTANSIDTASATLAGNENNGNGRSWTQQTSGKEKFIATSSANLALCLYKDNAFTRLFAAPGSTPRPVPLPTFALFTIRDCLTIFASFNLPPLLAPHMESRISPSIQKYVGALSIAQFATPAAVQIFSTPLHLLGLDLYNRPGVEVRERAGRVLRDWAKSAAARICRIVPAFGVGGVVNTKVRTGLMGRLEA